MKVDTFLIEQCESFSIITLFRSWRSNICRSSCIISLLYLCCGCISTSNILSWTTKMCFSIPSVFVVLRTIIWPSLITLTSINLTNPRIKDCKLFQDWTGKKLSLSLPNSFTESFYLVNQSRISNSSFWIYDRFQE